MKYHANKILVICSRLTQVLQIDIAPKFDMNLDISIVILVDNVKITCIIIEINVIFSQAKKIINIVWRLIKCNNILVRVDRAYYLKI